MQPQLRIMSILEVDDVGDITVVNFTESKILDEQKIQIMGEQLYGLVNEMNRRKILLNFINVKYFPAAALAKLIALERKIKDVGGKLILCNIYPEIYEIFEITRINRIFIIAKDEQEALVLFSEPVTS